jgi:hypothetical protein
MALFNWRNRFATEGNETTADKDVLEEAKAQTETLIAGASISPVGAANSYSAATSKVKVATPTEPSATKAAFVIVRAVMEAKKALKVKVNSVALVAPGAEGAAKEAVTLSFVVPVGQQYEIEASGVEGEPTVSTLLLS